MFDFFRKHTWLLKLVLGFVVLAFVGGGVYQGYGSFMGDDSTVAKVDGRKITRNEWDLAQRDQIERVRRQMPNVDAKLFDTPEMKRQSLDVVVRERVLLAAADKLHLTTTDERLQRLFVSDPQFAFLRNPDGSVNKDALSAQGMSSEMFAQRLRQDLSLRQVAQGITGTVFAPLTATNAALDAMFQQREVQVQQFATKDSLAKVTPSDADIEAYYKTPTNAAQFMAPEVESIEYVVLDLESLKKGITVSADELKKYYDENAKRYTSTEERRASHILVKVDAGASAADRAKAKTKAEGLLADVKKNPAAFADIARKNSDDPGSAEKGGDLDFFGRDGLAAKPLEDAAFKLKPDEVSDLVESDFGYHIVKLTAQRGGEKKPFDAVKAELENDVKAQLAQRKFSETAVEFTNTVYEQPDSLKPVVDKLKLELRSAAEPPAHARTRRDRTAHERKISGCAVRQRGNPQQAQHRGDRGRTEHAGLGPRREVRSRAPAAARRREDAGPRSPRRPAGRGARAKARRGAPGRAARRARNGDGRSRGDALARAATRVARRVGRRRTESADRHAARVRRRRSRRSGLCRRQDRQGAGP